jgi:hypothetical protein
MTLTQTDAFVSLVPALPQSAGEPGEFRATVISQPGQTQSFQPTTAAISAVAASAAHAPACEPKISLQREGNRVTGIHIQCSCGQVIELACQYDAAPAQPAPVAPPATIPQPEPAEAAPGKICNEPGKDLPISKEKKPKVPEKGRGTSAAKRRSA